MNTKAKLVLSALLMTAMTTFAACDSDDVQAASLPKELQQNFNNMFPKAKNVEWEKSGSYYIADFTSNTFDVEAWFNHNGSWAMTETDYNNTIVYLPEAVQATFMGSAYANAIIDDVNAYERVNDNIYTIEVENSGPDITLIYDIYGNLIKTVNYDVTITPTTVINAL